MEAEKRQGQGHTDSGRTLAQEMPTILSLPQAKEDTAASKEKRDLGGGTGPHCLLLLRKDSRLPCCCGVRTTMYNPVGGVRHTAEDKNDAPRGNAHPALLYLGPCPKPA